MSDETSVSIITAPEFISLLAHCFLFRLGGQQVLTVDEIADIANDHLGIRNIYDVEKKTFTLTLKPKLKVEGRG